MIYFDNNATTMMDPRVLDAMLPHLREQYANPSSVHAFGQQARHAVETAREQVAGALGASARQIVFTSGGTEANQLAIRGALAARQGRRGIVTTAVEHDSVLRLMAALSSEGYQVKYLGVNADGCLDPDEFAASLTDETALASIMHANNETGVLFPIERLGEIAGARGVPLHVDATQTIGKLPMDLGCWPTQLVTMAAHKFHGPKGVGALYVGRRMRLRPQLLGGHQERDLRAGTENVAGIVGMGEAIRLAVEHLPDENGRVRAMRDRLEAGLMRSVEAAYLNGERDQRIPNTTNISFEALEAEAILLLLSNEGLCASSGSACSTGSLEPSHVLQAMGREPRMSHSAIRFSLSRFNTDSEIDAALRVVPRVIERLRFLQPRQVVV